MDKKKSLQFNFGFEALPILFHSQTTDFINYLEKDGVEFLKFWWDHVGEQMDETKRIPPDGISYESEQHGVVNITFITFPTPINDGDPIFLACIGRPEKRFAWVRLPNTDVYILSRYDGCSVEHKTAFGEVSPRGLYGESGIGLNPTLPDFKRFIKKKLKLL
ncbi:MAG: hypothetical protein WCG34_02305 [Leptolinea sp.]